MTSDRSRRTRRRVFLVAAAVVCAVLVLPSAASLYTDLRWFRSVGQADTFETVLGAQFVVALIAGFFVLAFAATNIWIALRASARTALRAASFEPQSPLGSIRLPTPGRLALIAGSVAGLVAAVRSASTWETWLQFLNATRFGMRDPIFGRDVSYYVFRLPMYESVSSLLQWTIGLSALAAMAIYALRGSLLFRRRPIWISAPTRVHLSLLVSSFFLVLAWDAHLATSGLLNSTVGPVAGASWTDVHARLPALRVLMVVSILSAALIVVFALRPRRGLAIAAAALYLGVTLLGVRLYPSLTHRFGVVPNELQREARFIRYNIAATRAAYDLDDITERELPGHLDLHAEDIANNQGTIENIRLWDHEPLLSTFAQIQEIRTYYDFVSVDNDRYRIGGKLRQTMLSARELSTESLPNRTWINEHLAFTHGYGLTLGPVNEATTEGLPVLFIKDIPPTSVDPSLRITRPAIYYGERANDHVFVRTDVREFDYPAGENNVYAEYRGRGGIRLDSILTRVAMSIRLGSLQLLLSGQIDDDSRVLLYRRVHERVQQLAPFLRFDLDPYMVIREDGTLVWILDAYTTTDRFPYAEATGSINYIRNSVKAVVDAYDGSVTLYVSDKSDPMIRTWARAFPELFTPLGEMPADIRAHLRYPEGIFRIQSQVFAVYHMDSAELLYNREDQWEIPAIGGADSEGTRVEPYYTIMKLPGEREAEFLLMLPLTPKSKDNLAAWMAARMDGDRLGEIVAYRFPKDRLVYGPQQIVNRINQDPEISRQISLWDQRGSRAILGTLLVIPIEESLVYVQPLYIQSEGGRIPELKRVIVVYENRIAMTPSLGESMTAIFGTPGAAQPVAASGPPTEPTPPVAAESAAAVLAAERRDRFERAIAAQGTGDAARLAAEARNRFERAIAAQRRGDWAAYGEELERLGEILGQMAPRGETP